MAEIQLRGIGVSDGIRMGKAFLYSAVDLNESEYMSVSSDNVDAELSRLRKAKEQCIHELDQLIGKTKQTLGEEKAGIIKGQRSFLTDPAFYPKMEKLVEGQQYSAEKAVQGLVQQFAAIFEAMPNEYMRERAKDVRDLGRRLLLILSGKNKVQLSDIREEVILVADDLAPSETVQLDKKYILAFAAKTGGKTSHTAIFSRSLGIPAVLGIGDELDNICNGDFLIIDGIEGLCIINPDEATIDQYSHRMKVEQEQQQALKSYASKRAVTKDGHEVEIAANIGNADQANFAVAQGAQGIGLYRTEFLFMAGDKLPDEEVQYQAYKEVVQLMENKPVIIRTLDIGGDKKLPYLNIPKEMNPFLGYRAIRLCLDQKNILITQLRAILRASVYGKIKIMFPMISGMEEWRQVKKIYREVQAQLTEEGVSFDSAIELGIMVEVPSTALMASQLAEEVDFFSIGTNDLVQYTLAVDRMNEKVAYLYDYFHPAVIRLIKSVIDAAHAKGKRAGMCGDMAGDPLAAPLLIAMGLDEWSMSATSMQKVKHGIAQITRDDCKKVLDSVLGLKTTEEIHEVLKQFYIDFIENH
ncbi:phosphoenolpyruvate--protein phosphotransferase [Petroclostridium sp. X23]|uniref:phosphoenolpyruvate--protein phosphotransferase n=1 Tax=Petroclostridium sp. X23 TaxID=3045146 RepID=UPI0024AE3D90|nr:phosphoenolpyruvate--protein phosphotransferase [Petroclostridium sp. X23]WHH57707.1 phosphoenolpyruvate--protein phosphotransferase [Petroclostridium sp. X23]